MHYNTRNGNANTFFYRITIFRHKYNRITRVDKEDGSTVEDPREIHDMLDYFIDKQNLQLPSVTAELPRTLWLVVTHC